MSKIVVVGSCNIDITVECDRWVHPGETIFGNRLTVSPGGKGANQAVAAARLGADVMMVGCIGDDVYGQLVLKALKENNVDSTYVKVLPGENSGTAHITVAEDDNTIIVIKAANDLVSPELIDEGLARELISKVQQLRKQADYEMMDQIVITLDADDAVKAAVAKHADYIKSETLAVELKDGACEHTYDLNGHKTGIQVARV